MRPPLESFSAALIDLFKSAEKSSPDDFPAALLRVLGQHVGFDGAVVGHADPLCYGDFSIAVAHVHQREASLLEEYKAISAADPVTLAFLDGLVQPMAVDTERFYAGPEHAAMRAYTRKHRLRHLMLCGYAPSQDQRGRWIVLYRADDRPFEPRDIAWFGAFCQHLDRALDINRSKALDRPVPPMRRKGVALVDGDGRIETADPMFTVLLQTEFKEAAIHRLPPALMRSMSGEGLFEGRHVLGQFSPVGSRFVCELRDAGPLSRLSPQEGKVALRFAQGLNSREVAAILGVSPSTVHSQLASVYRKLAVSDKATLARVLADPDSR